MIRPAADVSSVTFLVQLRRVRQLIRTRSPLQAHVIDQRDPALTICVFAADLIDDGIYNDIAIALHAPPHRSVSLGLMAQALGAMPSASRKRARAKSTVMEVTSAATATAAQSKGAIVADASSRVSSSHV